MKKSIFATLALVGMLSIFSPADKAEAAWQTTSKGTRYTITQSPGYMVGLKKIDGKKYYFNKQGYMITGWFQTGGRRFYFDPKTGAMKTGRVAIGGKPYYFNPSNGVIVKNSFVTTNGNRFCTDSKGAMIA